MRWGEDDPVLTPFIRIQLAIFLVLTLLALGVLGLYFLRLPAHFGIAQYTLYADLPASGGLYKTANVTYRGIQIGKVLDVQPTERGVLATMSIDDRYKIPVNAVANVHSVSAVGEQYLDLVSTGPPNQPVTQYLADGQTMPTKGTVPDEVGPALDSANRGLAVLPKEKIDTLLSEASQAVGGLGPALQRLVDSTTNVAQDFKDNLQPVNDIVGHSGPILNSQVSSGDAIEAWAANLNVIGAQVAEQDAALRNAIQQAAPTADQLNAVFSGVQDSLPQTLANLEIVIDMLKRYHKGVEQTLVIFPEGASIAQTATSIYPGEGLLHFALGPIFAAIGASIAITPVGLLAIPPGAGTDLNTPPPCLTGFLPASEWRSPADTTMKDLPAGTYCKIPKETQGNVVRGARNYPCADVPGKRAASPRECRSNEPYVPLGTNPWYGDPNQIRNCPAPGARCDQPVDPGRVIPAPSINNGMNPLPANLLPPSGSPPPVSDQLSPPGQGTVTCSGQQPNPCTYTPSTPVAIYNPQSGEVVAPDGSRYSVKDSTTTGDDGWKEMLAPAG
jgi:phospholipid/cholesterol/gamma-HCH transport system substrate-binding protein